jgi:hypothetical protein
MAYDLVGGKTGRNFARGEPPARGSWEYAGVGSMWETGAALKKTNLKAAILAMQNLYAKLSKQAAGLKEIMARTKKPLPPEVAKAYNDSTAEYLRFGRDVFAELEKHGMKIAQIVLRDGKPQPDPKDPSKPRMITVAAPLRPPVFLAGETSGDNKPADEPADVVGLPLLLIPLVPFLIKGVVIIGAGGFVAIKALEKIGFIFRGPNIDPTKTVDSYIKLRAAGVPHEEAEQLTKPPPAAGEFPWGILIGLGVAGGGLYYWNKVRKPS